MPSKSSKPIVAIDGPAGAGKSTVARRVAGDLGYVYIDTGAMYRAVALMARRAGIAWDDAEALTELTGRLRFEFEPHEERPRLWVDGEDVSAPIRTPEISRGASEVSCWPGVREALVDQQRRLGAEGGVVMEGRDIGTVVFPQARLKVYLTASGEERARRRAEELRAGGAEVDSETVLREVLERDTRDMRREHSPLRKAEDAVEVCTDGLTIDEVVARIAALAREREQP